MDRWLDGWLANWLDGCAHIGVVVATAVLLVFVRLIGLRIVWSECLLG